MPPCRKPAGVELVIVVRREIETRFPAGWSTVSRQHLIRSRSYDLLDGELRRHLDRQVGGRSFLIAGYRGAGKTMLVQAVVDGLRGEIFSAVESSVTGSPQTPDGRVPISRRPLLVRLHGPALLAGAADASEPEASRPPPPAVKGEPEDGKGAPDAEQTGASAGSAAVQGGNDEATRSALAQITVALYRAFSDEFSDGFRLAAQEAVAGSGAQPETVRDRYDLGELSASLRLELDGGADAATMRHCLAQLDRPGQVTPGTPAKVAGAGRRRLEEGVLWPSRFARDWPDTGYREIAALAAAGQAFRKCIGAVKQEQRRTDEAERIASMEVKGGPGLSDASNKLFAAAVGAMVAYSGGTAHAFAAGGAALASLAVLSWSSSRSSRTKSSSEYSFLPDVTTQTLDRDLPIIIDRMRSLGLAPVFVVDEIDKVDRPDEAIRSLMRRLKQLTADYGFFCFLTDRDYFDRLESQLRTAVYPVEHTYFSHRLLVAYRADEIAAYLRARIGTTLQESEEGFVSERQAALLLGRVCLHRSELNVSQLTREITGFGGNGLAVRETAAGINASETYRLSAMLQLAIEHVMRTPDMSLRLSADPYLAQVAADALYMVSRKWRERVDTFVVDLDSVRTEIARRGRLRPTAPDGDADGRAADLGGMLADPDVAAFASAVTLVAELACDFEALKLAITAPGQLADEDRPLLGIFDPPLKSLLCREESGRYRFGWDPVGILTRDAAPQATPVAVSATAVSRLEELERADLTIDALASTGLLPSAFSDDAIRSTISRLASAGGKALEYKEAASDALRLSSFSEVFATRVPSIVATLHLVRIVDRRGGGVGGASALRALDRYVPLRTLAERSGSAVADWIRDRYRDFTGFAASDFSDGSDGTAVLIPTPDRPEPDEDSESDEAAWARWETNARRSLREERPTIDVRLDDVVRAARGVMPGRIFRYDLALLTVADWSFLVLESALFGSAPAWGIPFGLFRLGFGKEVLARVASRLDGTNAIETDRQLAAEIADRAPRGSGGTLVIGPSSLVASTRADASGPPVLYVEEADLHRFRTALEWLKDCNAFSSIEDRDDG